MVHVQVHARSATGVSGVNAWAIYCNASMGVPSLAASPSLGNAFLFWNQFQAGGAIVPNLPADSPWTMIGSPVPLGSIDVAHPQVASWTWTVPTLATGDPGHYCVVVFVHSAEHLINETGYDVDTITPTNPQIGQKNLHITAPLPHPSPPPPPRPWPRPGGGGMREYVEFHNPTAVERVATIAFDLRPLPPELRLWLRFTELTTVKPLDQSLAGIEAVHHPDLADHARDVLLAGIERGEEALHWLDRWLDRAEAKLGGAPDDDEPRRKRRPVMPFTKPIYRAKPSALVAVNDVRLPPFGAGAALLVMEAAGALPPGREYRFQAQQLVGGHVVGGCTYVVRMDGKLALPRPIVSPSHLRDPKTGLPPHRPPHAILNIAPWMTDIAEERDEVVGKFPSEPDVPIG
jgi:hypothetical protein